MGVGACRGWGCGHGVGGGHESTSLCPKASPHSLTDRHGWFRRSDKQSEFTASLHA